MGDFRAQLRAARERRGWGISQAASTLGIAEQSLRNLEGGSTATRPGDPAGLTTATLIKLIEGYWPDLQLSDVAPETLLKFSARDRAALRRLQR